MEPECARFTGDMEAHPKPVVVTRNRWVVPKQRRIEPLPSGYAVLELCSASAGYYWYVIIVFEMIPQEGADAC